MCSVAIKPWVEVAALHPDVLAEDFSEDIFALHLGPLTDGNPNVPAVYRDPEHFFRVSYLTKGLRSLLQDVLSRLEGHHRKPSNQVDYPFRRRQVAHAGLPVSRRPAAQGPRRDSRRQRAPPSCAVRTAVFDGQFFGATSGKAIPGESFSAERYGAGSHGPSAAGKGMNCFESKTKPGSHPAATISSRCLPKDRI